MALLYQFSGTTFSSPPLTDFCCLFLHDGRLSAKFSALKLVGGPSRYWVSCDTDFADHTECRGHSGGVERRGASVLRLLIGSVSFVGGPGTAAAWAKELQAIGLARAPEIAVAAPP